MTVGCRVLGEFLAGRVGSGDLGLIGLGLGEFGIDLPLACAKLAEQFDQIRITTHAAILPVWTAGRRFGRPVLVTGPPRARRICGPLTASPARIRASRSCRTARGMGGDDSWSKPSQLIR